MATDTRGKHVVLDLLQDQEEQQHPDHGREGQKHRHEHRGHGGENRSKHGDQLKQASQHAEHNRVRQPEHRHPDASSHADDQRQEELGAQVAAQDTRDVVLEKQRVVAVLNRNQRQAAGAKTWPVDEQVQRDHQGQDEVQDHST